MIDFSPRISHRFETSILSMRSAGLKSHHETLSGGMHDRISHFEASPVQPLKNFQGNSGPGFRVCRAPLFLGGENRLQQRVEVNFWISDFQSETVGRLFRASLPNRRRKRQRIRLMESRFERCFTVLISRLTIDLATRNLRKGAPVRALLNRCHRVFQELLMSRKERIRHSDSSVRTSSCSSVESVTVGMSSRSSVLAGPLTLASTGRAGACPYPLRPRLPFLL